MHQLPITPESEANLASASTEQIRQLGEIEKKIAGPIFSGSLQKKSFDYMTRARHVLAIWRDGLRR